MIQTTQIRVYQVASSQVLAQIQQALTARGFLVIQSFNLQVAKAAQSGCICPNHGTELCDCQMNVLQVYDDSGWPATLIAHGHGGITTLDIVNLPVQRPDTGMLKRIGSILNSIPEDGPIQALSASEQ